MIRFTKNLMIRITPKMYKELKEASENKGMGLSAFVRFAIFNEIKKG